MDRNGYRKADLSNGYSSSCGKEMDNLGDRPHTFMNYTLGNQTFEIHELNGRSEGADRKMRAVPHYPDVDDEHSEYGPKCIEDEPPLTNSVLFSCRPYAPLQPLELTLNRQNEHHPPTELRHQVEDRHHSPNDEGKFKKMRRKIEKEKELKKKNLIDYSNQEGFIGDKKVEELLDLFGVSASNAQSKSKKTGKSKGGRRNKNKEKSLPTTAAASVDDDGEDLDVEVELDTEEPAPPIERFEYTLCIENPFFRFGTDNLHRTPDEQKKKRWFMPVSSSAFVDGKPMSELVVSNSAAKRMWGELRHRWANWTELSNDPPIYYTGEEEASEETPSLRNSSSSSGD